MDAKIIKLILRKNKKTLAILVICMSIVQLATVYGADLMKDVLDELINSNNIDSKRIRLYIIVMLGQSICFFVFNYFSELTQNKAVLVMRKDFLNRYRQTAIGTILGENSQGELYEIVYGDITIVTNFCMNTFMQMAYTILTFSFVAVYFFMLRWDVFLLIMLLNFVMLIGHSVLAPVVNKYSLNSRNCIGDVANTMQELFSNPIDIKMSGLQNALIQRVYKALHKSFACEKKMLISRSASNELSSLIGILGHILVFLYGGYLVTLNKIGVGSVVVFIAYSQKLIGSFEKISHFTIDFSTVMPYIKRLTPFYEKPNPKKYMKEIQECSEIVLDNVSFAYQDDTTILDEVNYRFIHGKSYGIIGETGVGKSTLAKLLCGIYMPTHGKILISDIAIGNIAEKELERQMVYYPATPIIVNDTLYSNITLGTNNEDLSKVTEVVEKMQLTETIKKHSDGLNAIVGSGGCTLSAGEKQRIGLGRVFFSSPQIVIMDEPTAFLDDETKEKVMHELFQYNKNALFIIITHDMSILTECDNVLKIENGRIKECTLVK